VKSSLSKNSKSTIIDRRETEGAGMEERDRVGGGRGGCGGINER
jgi:hypothetical protein